MANQHTMKKIKIPKTSRKCAEILRKDFPKLYTEAANGLSCPVGWFPLVYELSETLQELANVYSATDQTFAIYCTTLKEKMASLRYYYTVNCKSDKASDIVRAVIGYTETQSEHICQVCGEYGEFRKGGWYLTLCDKHVKSRAEDIYYGGKLTNKEFKKIITQFTPAKPKA